MSNGRAMGGGIMSPELEPGTGYLRLTLRVHGRTIRRRVHRLIALAFHGPCPPGMQVRHLNGVPDDNRPGNLRYGTAAENKQDQAVHGRSGRSLTADLVREIRVRHAADARQTCNVLATAYGVSARTISQVLTGRTWAHIEGAARLGQRPQKTAKAWAKLTEQQVRAIRVRYVQGENQYELAHAFDLRQATVSQIIRRETWKWVDDEENNKSNSGNNSSQLTGRGTVATPGTRGT